MKNVNTITIKNNIVEIIREISTNINMECRGALQNALAIEDNSIAKFALEMMCKNANIANITSTPVCQDTGMCIVFLEIGQDVHLIGDSLNKAVNDGVAEAFLPLRKSIVSAITRINTDTNTPAIIHTSIVDGENIKLSVMLKGFGSENMSKLYMLTPSVGLDGIKNAVIETARAGGSNPCPPIIVGVGVGGDMEQAAIMSKHALLREVNSINPNPSLANLEGELLVRINGLNIGAQGFKGKTTALAVFIEEMPTHMSSIPVAVNILCHCQRSKVIIINE